MSAIAMQPDSIPPASMQEPSIGKPARNFWTLRSRNALVRILAFVVFAYALKRGSEAMIAWLRAPDLLSVFATPPDVLLRLMLQLLPFVGAYLLLGRLIENRRIRELAPAKLLPHTLAGFALGVVLLAGIVGVLWLLGGYRIDGVNADAPWFRELLLVGLLPGVIEEIVSRGVLYRIVEERWGSWIALAFSALMFGLMHADNPSATLWSSLAIAIEAGLLLGILYTVTRSLYVCIGLHMAWNFMEGPVLGAPVSGIDLQSLLQASLLGPRWLTGGTFGIEASVITVGLLGSLSAWLMVFAQRRGLIRTRPTRAQLATARYQD